jgi:hypothetical protein
MGTGSDNKCNLDIKDDAIATTGYSGITITTEIFPDKCAEWCISSSGGGSSCAGFEMKLWSNKYRCRAMDASLVNQCSSF